MAYYIQANFDDFVAGSTHSFEYQLFDLSEQPLTNMLLKEIRFRMAYYGRTDKILEKYITFSNGTVTSQDGITIVDNKITVRLYRNDTIDLHGKFTCQLTVVDYGNNYIIPDEKYVIVRPYIE